MKKIILLLMCFFTTLAFGQRASVTDSTLILWLPITNDSANLDKSVYKHDVEIKHKNVIFSYDRRNKFGAYLFKADYGYLQMKHIQELTYATLSICAWVKTKSVKKIERLLVLPTEDGGQIFSLNVNLSANKNENSVGKASVYFDPEDDKGPVSVQSTTNVSDNKWHFIVGIINVETMKMKIYIDGILEGEKTFISKPKPAITQKLQIGRHSENYQECFDGSIDDIRIYNREINLREIKKLFRE